MDCVRGASSEPLTSNVSADLKYPLKVLKCCVDGNIQAMPDEYCADLGGKE